MNLQEAAQKRLDRLGRQAGYLLTDLGQPSVTFEARTRPQRAERKPTKNPRRGWQWTTTPSNLRRALAMVSAGDSQTDVAAHLGVTRQAVSQMLRRARTFRAEHGCWPFEGLPGTAATDATGSSLGPQPIEEEW